MIGKSFAVMFLSASLLFCVGGVKLAENNIDKSFEASAYGLDTEHSKDAVSGVMVSDSYGSGYASWKEAYSNYIEEACEDGGGFEYALINLDDDDLPELYIDTVVEAGGEQVLAYHDGNLQCLQLSRIGSLYLPGSGLLYNNCGHMDYYPVFIYKLYQGDFYQIGTGIWGSLDWENGYETDENGCLIYQYEWEGTRCSEEEFHEKINELFPVADGVRAENWYNRSEMLSVLNTGHHSAYGHSYELFTGDLTWEEAQRACVEKGGYLATITSPEERQIITELIEAENKTEYSFYVGFKAFCRIDGVLQEEGWIEKDGSLCDGHSFTDFEFYFFPGYDYNNEEWDFTLGQIGLMKYSNETNKIYKFEAPMNLLSYAPQYSGKIGFICEYE